jgi:hypothetical protein
MQKLFLNITKQHYTNLHLCWIENSTNILYYKIVQRMCINIQRNDTCNNQNLRKFVKYLYKIQVGSQKM